MCDLNLTYRAFHAFRWLLGFVQRLDKSYVIYNNDKHTYCLKEICLTFQTCDCAAQNAQEHHVWSISCHPAAYLTLEWPDAYWLNTVEGHQQSDIKQTRLLACEGPSASLLLCLKQLSFEPSTPSSWIITLWTVLRGAVRHDRKSSLAWAVLESQW